MKFKIGDKVIFRKGDWLDHPYIDNCRGTIIDVHVVFMEYMIEWILVNDYSAKDIFIMNHEDYLHLDIKTIRNDKLNELLNGTGEKI